MIYACTVDEDASWIALAAAVKNVVRFIERQTPPAPGAKESGAGGGDSGRGPELELETADCERCRDAASAAPSVEAIDSLDGLGRD